MDTLSVGKWDYGILTFLVWIDLVFLWNDAKNAGPNFRKNPNWEWKTSWPAGHWRHIPRPMVIVTTWPAALTLALDLARSIANYVTLNWKKQFESRSPSIAFERKGAFKLSVQPFNPFFKSPAAADNNNKIKKKKIQNKKTYKKLWHLMQMQQLAPVAKSASLLIGISSELWQY